MNVKFFIQIQSLMGYFKMSIFNLFGKRNTDSHSGMKYAKIIDKGECYSTLNLNVSETPANRNEWAKYNFYPKNGMVGIVLEVNGYNVLKINEGIYVPMSARGIEYINEQEYERGLPNNVCTGMDVRQTNINQQYDSFQQKNLPHLKESFKSDIRQNIERKTVDFTRNIFINDLIDEAVYYAADMCLEFYIKSGNNLPQYWIDHITNEVCGVFFDFFPGQFVANSAQQVRNRVDSMMTNKTLARISIDDYYAKVKQYYSVHS